MNEEKRLLSIKMLNMVMEDVEKDAEYFDGQPFNGKTVGEYMGYHGAAIKAIAEAVKILFESSTPKK